MRPRIILPEPEHHEPPVDGIELREFRLLIPPDGPAGVTLRWVWSRKGAPTNREDSMALALDEMPAVGDVEAAIGSWLLECLIRKGVVPSSSTAVAGTTPPKPTPRPSDAGGMILR